MLAEVKEEKLITDSVRQDVGFDLFEERFTPERLPILFCYSLPTGGMGTFFTADKIDTRKLKKGKQEANRESLTRIVQILCKEQEQKVAADYKDQIKPIVDSIIGSLFIGDSDKPAAKYDYKNLLND